MLFIVTVTASSALADSRAQYIANAGVMVMRDDVKVLFDPLFDEDFGVYDRAADEVQRQLVAGEPPFDGVDAVFISHSHDDHFDPSLLLEFLAANEGARLYGPAAVLAAVRRVDASRTEALRDRISVVSPERASGPVVLRFGVIEVAAIDIPHEGWPDYHADVENIVFSVTLDAKTTVAHLGDADPRVEHFAGSDEYWRTRHHHMAFPPYWFFLREEGRKILDETVSADHAVGMHVPTEVADEPAERQPEFEGFDLFTRPGEERRIP